MQIKANIKLIKRIYISQSKYNMHKKLKKSNISTAINPYKHNIASGKN